ncbi:DUF393 domain-containing protein [Verrucomicrobia bacterium]|nr:DUF393 domain-containing protein [Verrucomicrobiota bacterium]
MNTNVYPPFLFIELVNFHWIYWFFDRPGVLVLEILQGLLLLLGVSGLLGIYPRICARVILIGIVHLLGFMHSSNAELDGSTLALVAMASLSISPEENFYSIRSRLRAGRIAIWPIYFLWLFVGAFYTSAGLNKLLDIGPHWPLVLNLDSWSAIMKERMAFITSRHIMEFTHSWLDMKWFSVFSGVMTVIGEVGFISILFFPRGRFFFVFSMIALHFIVYVSMSINFMGSGFILILCLDWNSLVRRGTVYYDGNCGICSKIMAIIGKLDFFDLLSFKKIEEAGIETVVDRDRLEREMAIIEDNGLVSYGAEAFEVVFEKIPVLWPLAIIYKIPFVIYPAKQFYIRFASIRHMLPGSTCRIPSNR